VIDDRGPDKNQAKVLKQIKKNTVEHCAIILWTDRWEIFGDPHPKPAFLRRWREDVNLCAQRCFPPRVLRRSVFPIIRNSMSTLMVFKNNLLRRSYGELARGGGRLDMKKP
jgi:hypothetical protein